MSKIDSFKGITADGTIVFGALVRMKTGYGILGDSMTEPQLDIEDRLPAIPVVSSGAFSGKKDNNNAPIYENDWIVSPAGRFRVIFEDSAFRGEPIDSDRPAIALYVLNNVTLIPADRQTDNHVAGSQLIPRKPHSFCQSENPEENCTLSYCDENGCQSRPGNSDHHDLKSAPTQSPTKK